jgi:hypothetical protein
MPDDIKDAAREIAEACYINQMRSDAAYHKTREIACVLLKFKGTIVEQEEDKRRDLERRLYIAEKAVADNKL